MTLREDINKLLQSGIDAGRFPGCQYAVVYADKPKLFDALGYRQTHPVNIPVDGSEIYDVASLTKVIATTTMIMKLIERHQLSLDTPVVEILEMFHHREITIRHLLTHTSGLPADIPRANKLRNKDDVLNHIFHVDLINPVGTRIVYSDIGFILLGLVIQKITKKPLFVLAKEMIFEPLGMSDTGYQPKKDRCAPTEHRDDDVYTGFLQGLVHDEKAFALQGNAGHAGLFSTARDIAKFIRMFLVGDETVLKKETQDLLFPARAHDTNKNNYPLVRAYGWDKPTPGGTAGDLVDPDETIVHTGFTGCNMWIDRAHGVGFVMLSNAVHPKRENNRIIPYRKQIGTLILSAEEGQTT